MKKEHLPHLDSGWATLGAGARLAELEAQSPGLRDAIAASGTVKAVRTFDAAVFPYPTRYAFFEACSLPVKYVWLTNRALLVEYDDLEGEGRRILINPAWPEGARTAPYFAQMLEKTPPMLEGLLGKQFDPLPDQLIASGIDPSSIDYVTFDHLHVQHVTPMLGTHGFYPKAKLLVTSKERASATDLHPLQQHWYVRGALEGLVDDNFIEFDTDVLIGKGIALVRTPGHTEGNHTIVLSLPEGLVTISENGVCLDSYVVAESEIPGLRAFGDKFGLTAALNANTREHTLDQYASMRIEGILSYRPGERFPRHFASSELTPYRLAPGIKPTESVTKLEFGQIRRG